MILFRGDYLSIVPQHDDVCTAVQFIGDHGECRMKLFLLKELPFLPEWKPYSLRGYQQFASLTPEQAARLDLGGVVTRWNWRIPENGSIHFCETREERDAILAGDLQ